MTKNLMPPPSRTERLAELATAFKLPTVAAQLGPRLLAAGHDEALETAIEAFEMEVPDETTKIPNSTRHRGPPLWRVARSDGFRESRFAPFEPESRPPGIPVAPRPPASGAVAHQAPPDQTVKNPVQAFWQGAGIASRNAHGILPESAVT